MPRLPSSRHFAPLAFLIGLSLLFWGRVLFTGQVLLPGGMLKGFVPFGSDPQAPWNILQWDALAQYYPWRLFAARQLQAGHIPLWNPHQFSGAPFLANGQSAIFYPLHLPFWLCDVAWAFGFSAFLHTLLAALGTYALLQFWNCSRWSSVLGAIAFAFCGYLTSWIMLPTLANTAAWLPLCIWLFERGVSQDGRLRGASAIPLGTALACALLAGHAQVFFYILVALALRAFFLQRRLHSLAGLAMSGFWCVGLCAIQILPTLELARLGHRAGGGPTSDGWNFLVPRALQITDLTALFLPLPLSYSFSENFGYVGVGVFLLSLVAITALLRKWSGQHHLRSIWFALALALFGVLYAAATPLSKAFYFFVPGLSQMGGVGRALILWSFGIALLGAFGLDALRQRWKSEVIPVIAVFIVGGELFANGLGAMPESPRAAIYPQTNVTRFLQSRSAGDARVLFLTPRSSWLPDRHPPGVLPPNGAMVYGINDVNGYDSLSPRAYRGFLIAGEGADVSPQLNGNMILLNNVSSASLDALNVHTIVSEKPLELGNGKEVLRADGVIIYERVVKNVPRRDGKDFSPGWRDGRYQPESFRLGAFISLLTLGLLAAIVVGGRGNFPSTKPSE